MLDTAARNFAFVLVGGVFDLELEAVVGGAADVAGKFDAPTLS